MINVFKDSMNTIFQHYSFSFDGFFFAMFRELLMGSELLPHSISSFSVSPWWIYSCVHCHCHVPGSSFTSVWKVVFTDRQSPIFLQNPLMLSEIYGRFCDTKLAKSCWSKVSLNHGKPSILSSWYMNFDFCQCYVFFFCTINIFAVKHSSVEFSLK